MKNYLFAILSGVLVALSFPTVLFGWKLPNLAVLGWVALVPLFVSIYRKKPRKTFLLSFVFGLVCYGISLYWIFGAVHVFGGMSAFVSVLLTILLVVVVSAHIALAPVIASWISSRWKGEMIIFMPVAWVAIEFSRAYLPAGGFPWANIAMSQWSLGVPLQIVDLVGIYGLIFVMVWVNWLIAELLLKLRGTNVRLIFSKVLITVLILCAVIAYGLFRLNTFPEEISSVDDQMISVGVIQGNIPQEDKWQLEKKAEIVNIYRGLTKRLFDSGTDLIIWPEASLPFLVSEKVTSADPKVLGLDETVIGSLPVVMLGAVIDGGGRKAYNSTILFNAHGDIIGRYDKFRLVPFGEYVPYKKILFFAKKLTAPVGDFISGESLQPLEFEKGKIGPLICYEDIFPRISRKLTENGANILVNITNDAWYGVSSAAYQHMALSVFRAVENRRYMIRSTNTGVSAIISPLGDVLMDSPLFQRTVLAAAVVPLSQLSLYTKNGDWFAWACVAYTILGLIIAIAGSVSRKLRISGES